MEVSFDAGETSEVVPVSFESIVTETGMLQLWCVARDGRRWKLEFNVRERVQGLAGLNKEIDSAIEGIMGLRKRNGKITFEELRSAREEGRKY